MLFRSLLLILNLPLVGLWVQMLKVRYSILAPIIVLVCSIGVYSMKNNVMDVVLMVVFGVLGYILRKLRFELGPLLLAFVLGKILEQSLRQALLISRGNFAVFFTRPISAALLGVVVFIVVSSVVFSLLKLVRGRQKAVGT